MSRLSTANNNFRLWLRDKIPFIIVFTLIILLIIAFLWQLIFISIKAGQAGVLYKRFSGGTVIDYVYPEGLHIISPLNEMFIYETRHQTVKHEFSVLTNKGLPITLKLAIRFYPEYEMLGVLHQRVGPDYVNKIVIPQVESVLRRSIGRYDPEVIYTNKEGILTTIIVSALEEIGQKYVHVDDIIIRTLELPASIQGAIEEKLVYEQQYKAYEFRLAREKQEAERKRIEAAGIKDYQQIISQTLTEQMIKWQGVQATLELSQSQNAKVVVIGSGEHGLPIILGGNQ